MKTQFPGYFKPTKSALAQLWKTGLFVFDANILLGFYRYSDKTRSEFLQILNQIKDRCWLPHQSAKEYFNGRLAVIGQQEDAYSDTIKALNDIREKFDSPHQHPFLDAKLLSEFTQNFERVAAELQKSKHTHSKRISDDDILSELESLFKGRVGEPFTDDELLNLFKEGEIRYEKKMPPGFKDIKKTDDSEPGRKYGDLVLWKQILNKAAAQKAGVIFISDDRKEDWWLQFKGKTLGPRPELIREFVESCGSEFHMYASDRFIEFAGEQLGVKPSEDAVSEMRELKKIDAKQREKAEVFRIKNRGWITHEPGEGLGRIDYLQRVSMVQMEKNVLQETRDNLIRAGVQRGEALSQQQAKMAEINQKILRLELEENELRHLIDNDATGVRFAEDERRAREKSWTVRQDLELERAMDRARDLERVREIERLRDAQRESQRRWEKEMELLKQTKNERDL